jgi:hypothetical protein
MNRRAPRREGAVGVFVAAGPARVPALRE